LFQFEDDPLDVPHDGGRPDDDNIPDIIFESFDEALVIEAETADPETGEECSGTRFTKSCEFLIKNLANFLPVLLSRILPLGHWHVRIFQINHEQFTNFTSYQGYQVLKKRDIDTSNKILIKS
jgi:hypothetical protein